MTMQIDPLLLAFVTLTLMELFVIVWLVLRFRQLAARAPAGENDAWECGI